MPQRLVSAGILCLLLSLPLAASAASGGALLRDAARSGTQLKELLQDEKADNQLRTIESQDSLFPLPSADAQQANQDQAVDGLSVIVGGQTVVFGDVPKTSWFAPFVLEMVRRSVMTGYQDEQGRPTGTFGAADRVTIEQLAKMAAVAAGIDPSSCPRTLKNATAQGRWSAPYVACAEAKGWSVFSDGSANVTRSATRAEAVVTLLQAFAQTPLQATGRIFADVGLTTPFASFIERAALDEIVSGYGGADAQLARFGPGDSIDRAAMAKVISKAIQAYRPAP